LVKSRKAVAVALSEVILVAIAIALVFAAVTWILGVWSFEQEKFTAVPIIYVSAQEGSGSNYPVLQLHLKNDGTRDVVIIKVAVYADNGYWENNTRIVVPAGSAIDVTISDWRWVGEGDPPRIIAGEKYRVVVYTEEWGAITFEVVASK